MLGDVVPPPVLFFHLALCSHLSVGCSISRVSCENILCFHLRFLRQFFFFMLPFWVWETETQTTAVPVYTKWICFNLIVCLIYWSFSCNTCKAQPHIISWQARKNPVGKRVSFFSPSLFSSFFGAAKLLFSKDAKNFSAPTMSLVCLALRCEDFHTVYNLVLFNNSFTGLFSCATWRLWTARKNSQQVSVCLLFAMHICAWKWEGKLGWVIESL